MFRFSMIHCKLSCSEPSHVNIYIILVLFLWMLWQNGSISPAGLLCDITCSANSAKSLLQISYYALKDTSHAAAPG